MNPPQVVHPCKSESKSESESESESENEGGCDGGCKSGVGEVAAIFTLQLLALTPSVQTS